MVVLHQQNVSVGPESKMCLAKRKEKTAKQMRKEMRVQEMKKEMEREVY